MLLSAKPTATPSAPIMDVSPPLPKSDGVPVATAIPTPPSEPASTTQPLAPASAALPVAQAPVEDIDPTQAAEETPAPEVPAVAKPTRPPKDASSEPITPIVLAAVLFIVLSALAYFAYTKSN